MSRVPAVLLVLAVAGLAGCMERDQSTANARRSPDSPAWQSASSPYVAPGYAPGDKAQWEAQLRRRAQGQNDYAPRL